MTIEFIRLFNVTQYAAIYWYCEELWLRRFWECSLILIWKYDVKTVATLNELTVEDLENVL